MKRRARHAEQETITAIGCGRIDDYWRRGAALWLLRGLLRRAGTGLKPPLGQLATALDARFQVELEPGKPPADGYDVRYGVAQADESQAAERSALPGIEDPS